MKPDINIYHVSGHCWKGFEGQRWKSRSEVKKILRVTGLLGMNGYPIRLSDISQGVLDI